MFYISGNAGGKLFKYELVDFIKITQQQYRVVKPNRNEMH